MRLDTQSFFKTLSPRIATKALAALDKSTAVVVGICWLAALILLFLAVSEVHNAAAIKKEAAEAVAVEPVLPVATTTGLAGREGPLILERLQRQFPDIKFDLDGNVIIVKSDDGSKFHLWITAISYIDTMAPQFRWNLRDLCVGHCGSSLMAASITGQRVVFSLPQSDGK